jgi:hypothetical protein
MTWRRSISGEFGGVVEDGGDLGEPLVGVDQGFG